MNVNNVLTMDYENWTLGESGKTKPIQTRFPAYSKMNVTSSITMNYEQQTINYLTKTNPTCPAKPPPKQDRTICCNYALNLASILPKWHYSLIIEDWKMRFENPNLLKNKRLSAQGCLGPPIGTHFANHNLGMLSIP